MALPLKCTTCDGDGRCDKCRGRGVDPKTQKRCSECRGSGECADCDGDGVR